MLISVLSLNLPESCSPAAGLPRRSWSFLDFDI
jgi:hypothetical protein